MTPQNATNQNISGKLYIIRTSGDEGQDEMSHSSMECRPVLNPCREQS